MCLQITLIWNVPEIFMRTISNVPENDIFKL